MKIKVKNQEKELLVQTVSLKKNEVDPENLYMFRCVYCGTAINQIQGLVTKITAGLEPTDNVVIINQCRECKRLYTFQTLEFAKGVGAKVVLINNYGNLSTFRCYICRNPILQFMSDKVLKLPELEISPLPFSMECPNSTCPATYTVVDVV